MKKTIVFCSFIILSFVFTSCDKSNATNKINKDNLESAKTRDLEIKNGAASISFNTTEYDFGTVNEGDIIEKIFKVTNPGKTDLIIVNAQASCGCTVPVWPKEPIKAGETKDIVVKFDTSGKPNTQSTTVTLTTNTEANKQILRLKGSVTPKT